MGKYANPLVMDEGLKHIQNNCNRITACSGQPTTYSLAITAVGSGNMLGDLGALDAADLPLADSPGGGRQCTVLSQTIQMTYSGSFDHLALVDDTNSILIYVIPVTAPQTVVGGNTVDTGDVTITISDVA
ncbi:MAG: hypothetical protein QNL04_10855 [SAR324 cluster bacterium]|nr:hypothetical protein [SAR324 cluster bacterium]